MKRIAFFLSIVVLIAACQTKPGPVTVDLTVVKDSVTKVMEVYNAAMKSRNVDAVNSFYTDNLLYTGTDPGEFWNKAQVKDIINQMLADTSVKMDYIIDKQEILVTEDGNSAMILEQVNWTSFTGHIPVRMIFHAIKNSEGWKFDFISANFIADNEDVASISELLGKDVAEK